MKFIQIYLSDFKVDRSHGIDLLMALVMDTQCLILDASNVHRYILP